MEKKQRAGAQIKRHILTAIGYMIPLVVAAGYRNIILIGLSSLLFVSGMLIWRLAKRKKLH